MKKEPLISVALCTYNGEKFISQQLDSILCQTYAHLEIIIVDDCSTDDTFNIVSNYAKKDSRINCFKNEVNKGFNKNFEYAIKLTTAEYIAVSDQDDIWLPQKIELLFNNIESKWLIFSNSSYINERNEIIPGEILNNFNQEINNYKGILLANFITGHTTLFKREFLDYFLPLPEEGFYDWWMGFVALYHQKATVLNEVLTQYRIHESSVMQRRLNSVQTKSAENETIDVMLSAFATYKDLEYQDKIFIEELENAYKLNLSQRNSTYLITIILKYYEELFPNQKKRKRLSLLNFAFKYARKAKN
jgi:glycosyltransferase involved in cell wall biosynthesis